MSIIPAIASSEIRTSNTFVRLLKSAVVSGAAVLMACTSDARTRALADTSGRGGFTLDLVRTIEFPPRFAFGGAVFGSGDTIYVWSRNGTVFSASESQQLDSVAAIQQASVVGFTMIRGTPIVVDAAAKQIRTLVDRASKQCDIPSHTVHSGLFGDDGRWYISGSDSAGNPVVLISQLDLVSGKACPAWALIPVLPKARGSIFRRAGSGVWFTFRDPRQGSVSISDVGVLEPLAKPTEPAQTIMELPSDTAERWVGLMRSDLGANSLQLIADTRTSARRLILRRADGTALRAKSINGMWGLIESDSKRNLLIAAHETSGYRLLIYHWRWYE